MGIPSFRFAPGELPAEAEAWRAEVRDFLEQQKAVEGSLRFSGAFSRATGARGWIGMTSPKEHGGHAKSALERHVVTEEMPAAGAPTRAHWVADRQSGPLLLRFGSEQQKRTYLPRIARGADRHEGVSQFLVDLASPATAVRPIHNMAGEHDFNEVIFDKLFVPDEMGLGTVGNGWNQLTSELADERSGPERWLGRTALELGGDGLWPFLTASDKNLPVPL